MSMKGSACDLRWSKTSSSTSNLLIHLQLQLLRDGTLVVRHCSDCFADCKFVYKASFSRRRTGAEPAPQAYLPIDFGRPPVAASAIGFRDYGVVRATAP